MAGDELPQSLPPDVDHRHAYMAAIITFTVIAVLIGWLRLYTRLYISCNAWWDDWIMLIATFLTILTNGILIQAFQLGLGRHIYYIPAPNIPECFKWLWAAEPTNLFALYAVRISITLFFLRLIPRTKKFYRRLVWGMIWALTISDIYVSINYFIQCRPIQKVWLPDTPGTCLSGPLYAAAPWLYQAVSILADIALMAIPILMFRSLKLPTNTKIGVIALCCLGVFTCIIAIVKTALLPALFDHEEKDKTWSMAQLCFWAPMEICVGMICGSLPCLKPLYHHILHHGRSPTTVSTSSRTASHSTSKWLQSRDRNSKYSPQKSVDLELEERNIRSKSEESILPRAHTDRNADPEYAAVPVAGGALGHGLAAGIVRTTEVEFRTEKIGEESSPEGMPRTAWGADEDRRF